MVLMPGTKTDLVQAMENSPSILEQKDKFIKAMIAREDAQRRVALEAGGDGGATEVPTYTLPAREPPLEEPD